MFWTRLRSKGFRLRQDYGETSRRGKYSMLDTVNHVGFTAINPLWFMALIVMLNEAELDRDVIEVRAEEKTELPESESKETALISIALLYFVFLYFV